MGSNFQETDLAGHPSAKRAIRCANRNFDRKSLSSQLSIGNKVFAIANLWFICTKMSRQHPLWRIGSRIVLVNLTGNVAVHPHVGMTFWQIFFQNSSTMIRGDMLQANLPCGSPLKVFMYSSAEPTLVCRVLSPRVLCLTRTCGKKIKKTRL